MTPGKSGQRNNRGSSRPARENTELAARLDAVREEERTRVAREIHDELGQALTVLKLDLAWLETKTPPSQRQSRKKMRGMIRHVDETIECVRRIVSELRPTVLDDLGLIPAIEWQVLEFQKRSRIACRFTTNIDSPNPELERDLSVAVFRVIQEGLTNVARHAEASVVTIHLTAGKRTLRLVLADNGKGFVP